MRAGLLIALLVSLPLRSGRTQQPAHPAHPPPSDTARRRVPGQEQAHRHAEGMMEEPLGLPMSRDGSGTAWLPDSSPMQALHGMAGPWQLMLHGNAFLQYIRESGDRGADQVGSINWLMGMARARLAGGSLTLRAMVSAEPVTVGECGYPDLLATGESCGELGRLHDRQHPHDLFMELTASYQRAISSGVAVQLYGGPVGEPALGPVAYPHRTSSLPNPLAPIGHHWLDATHLTFGVVTAGVYGRRWKLEGSVFNGREPDQDRYDFDLAPLDSYSGRLWIMPSPRWAVQGSIGHLTEVEPGFDGGPPTDQTRLTASVTHHGLVGKRTWASTVAWGQNREDHHTTNAILAESSLDLGTRSTFFVRLEGAEKAGRDLVLEDVVAEEVFRVSTLAAGYLHRFPSVAGFSPGLGTRVGVSFVPRALKPYYGSRTPVGVALFLNLLPARTETNRMSGM